MREKGATKTDRAFWQIYEHSPAWSPVDSEEYPDWDYCYCEERLYAIHNKVDGGMYLIESESPGKALETVFARILNGVYA